MAKLPPLTAREIIAALAKAGFHEVRRKGSHVRLAHADSRRTTVPDHGHEPIGPGLLSKILRDVEMSRDEFLGLL